MIEKKFNLGAHEVSMQTGRVARQADGAVMVNIDGTVVLATIVAEKETTKMRDFFPLIVNYQEKTYAAGKIPGGFFKREGKPSEFETLTARLIDRPIRPLFPKNFHREVQVMVTVLSLNPDVSPDIPSMIGVSAAIAVSGVPFNGPIGAVRVGYKDGIYLLNPNKEDMESSDLDLIVAGTKTSVLMVEAQANKLSEKIMLGGVLFGHEMMQEIIKAIEEMRSDLNVKTWEWEDVEVDSTLYSSIQEKCSSDLTEAYSITDKAKRYGMLKNIRANMVSEFVKDAEDEFEKHKVEKIVFDIEKNLVRHNIIKGEPRIDGRDTKTVRDINVDTSILPRAHGSSLFTRGETQAIVATTLGTERDMQIIDALDGERRERFMFHYNFPPYSVGEIGMQFGPKRREIGHGYLARRAIESILPDMADFPYAIRVVSEITESNGSSSMASVCGASLALMDCGVPVSAPVAGVAMGLIKEEDQFVVLTDILGDEDHLGDMDFKVAGTVDGVTALQMDIKIDGIDGPIMEQALEQAREARLHILDIMNTHLKEPRQQLSDNAPRFYTMNVPTAKIRDIIGKGGVTIRKLTEETGVNIDIDDSGILTISSPSEEKAEAAKKKIKQIIADVEEGAIYEGVVEKIVDFGAFVSVLPGKEGLLHISQISQERIDKVTDVLKEGQKIKVKVISVERGGRFKLSAKDVAEDA